MVYVYDRRNNKRPEYLCKLIENDIFMKMFLSHSAVIFPTLMFSSHLSFFLLAVTDSRVLHLKSDTRYTLSFQIFYAHVLYSVI